ncbi:MAG: hypothetical protein WC955_10000 [Elusimicrobiota bacterium]
MTIFAEMSFTAELKPQYYSVHVKTFSKDISEEGTTLYEKLKQKGYMTYYYHNDLTGYQNEELRLYIGCSKNKEETIKYCETIKQQEGFDCYVETANVYTNKYLEKYHLICTPSTLWFSSGTINKAILEYIYTLRDTPRDLINPRPFRRYVVSPSGQEMIFECESIIKVDLIKHTTSTLLEDAGYSYPKWSYTGEYIAYADELEWEVRTCLWVMKSDGTKKKCLVDNKEQRDTGVKSFIWHPNKNIIIFVEGPAFGTRTVGGNLYSVDLEGNRKDLVIVDYENTPEEVCSEFDIKEGHINYKIYHHDSSLEGNEVIDKSTFTKHKLKLE